MRVAATRLLANFSKNTSDFVRGGGGFQELFSYVRAKYLRINVHQYLVSFQFDYVPLPFYCAVNTHSIYILIP